MLNSAGTADCDVLGVAHDDRREHMRDALERDGFRSRRDIAGFRRLRLELKYEFQRLVTDRVEHADHSTLRDLDPRIEQGIVANEVAAVFRNDVSRPAR